MADWLKTIKNVMDAHGAWLFGGAVAAGLVARRAALKRSSFDADWFQVTCYGCGRSGFSDEFSSLTTPDGRDAYRCVRCDRPDLFKQAEGGHPSIDDDYYQVENHQCPRCKSMVTESDSCGGECAQCWACGCDCDTIVAARIITNDPHDYEVDDHILIVDGTIREVAGNSQMDFFENDDNDWDQYQIAVITSVDPYTVEVIEGRYGNKTRASEDVDDMIVCESCGELRKVDEDFTIDNAREDTLDDASVSCDRCWENHYAYVEGDDGCTCDDLPDDHPDWMKGMCESCYDRWASAWSSKGAEATNACPHCEGAAGFPREFYYQSDRIDMVPCGTCLTQGRCPGCMEIYPGLTRDNTPEDVFFNTGCTRCGYSESDAREARRTARRWVELVDNPAAAKFMSEYDDLSDSPEDHPELHTKDYIECEGCSNSLSFAEVMNALGWTFDGYCDQCVGERMEAEDDLDVCNICGDRTHTDTVEIQVCEKHTASDYGLFYPDHWEGDAEGDHSTGSLDSRVRNIIMALREMAANDDPDYTEVYNGWADTIEELLSQRTKSAEDYGIGAVWMSEWNAERYDPNTHGAFLPAGSVKRFLSTIPIRTPFFVEFQKSNGDLRSMNAIFTKPFDADGTAAGVLEVFPGDSSKRSSFKRFRVDRVITLYQI